MSDERLWHLRHPSQEFQTGPRITYEQSTLRVDYDYELADGIYAWEAFSFMSTPSFRFIND